MRQSTSVHVNQSFCVNKKDQKKQDMLTYIVQYPDTTKVPRQLLWRKTLHVYGKHVGRKNEDLMWTTALAR